MLLFLSNSNIFIVNGTPYIAVGSDARATGNGLRVILLLCPYYHHNVHATGRIRYADTRYFAFHHCHLFYRYRAGERRPTLIQMLFYLTHGFEIKNYYQEILRTDI